MAARMSPTSGAATSNSASNSTFLRATRASTRSFPVAVTKYSCSTWRETTPVPARRCSAMSSRARRCFAGAALSSEYTRTFVSKKLRTLMDLIPVETPAAGVAAAREFPEFLDAPLGVVPSSQLSEVVSNQLVQALAESGSFLSGASDGLLVNRESDIHWHSICAQGSRVKRRIQSCRCACISNRKMGTGTKLKADR